MVLTKSLLTFHFLLLTAPTTNYKRLLQNARPRPPHRTRRDPGCAGPHRGNIVRTPLVRLELGAGYPDIRLKLENLQPINAYKLRGAANAVALLTESERRRGVWTISAGNADKGSRTRPARAGVPCTVVAIETAPASKLERMKALGARLVLVPYEVAWKALEDRAYEGVDGTFVHPFDDHNFIAGHATMAWRSSRTHRTPRR